jgi:Fic family protein
MDHPRWIWQQPDWPHFHWQPERLAPLLRECVQAQGKLLGMSGSVSSADSIQNELDALLQNILTSSAIEGEQLDDGPVSRRSEGLAELMMDATQQFAQPFTLTRLLNWHQWLFPAQEAGFAARAVNVGALRGDEPMQVVSGRIDRPTVHFETPPRQGLKHALETSQKATLDVTNWLEWFLKTLLRSLQQAMARIDRVLAKTRFWQQHRDLALSAEQIKVLNRLLDGGDREFEDGISAAQYQAVVNVSKATATRHLADLLERNCLARLPGGGRSTRYQINRQGE